MDKGINMTWQELHVYVAEQVANFCRDNMMELNSHPMDYQDHHEYIEKLYRDYVNQFGADI